MQVIYDDVRLLDYPPLLIHRQEAALGIGKEIST